MDCKVNKPYPKVQVEGPNIKYANLLLEDYSGMVSELSAITQYVYQKFKKFNTNEEFAETLSQIAMVEMKHLELLGETINLLGVDPKLVVKDKSNILTYWSSSFIDYTTNIVDMLVNDIKIEQEAIAKYKYDISIINDRFIKQILCRIIEDEEKHIECFKMLLSQVEFNY